MKPTKFIKEASFATAVFLLLFCFVSNATAENTAEADTWQYEFTIYGWFPSLDGQLKYDVPPGSGGDVTVDVSDFLNSLNFIFMGIFEARHNKFSFAADVVYLDLSNSTSSNVTIGPGSGVPLSVHGGLSLKTWLVTGTVGYDIVQTNKARTALIGGVRYLDLATDVSLSVNGPLPPTPPPAYLSGSEDFWDVIVGVRGSIMLNEKWYIPYYADIGTGDSKMTWQLYSAIGYRFHWGDIRLGYRYLEYDQDDDKLLQDLKLYGPLLGVGFRF